MKNLLKILLLVIIVLLFVLFGLLFTQKGNDIAKPYLKAELEKQIGLPVEVDLFMLRYDNIALKIIINNGLSVDVKSIFNLISQEFDGIYKIYAQNFFYEGISLDEANINGEYSGVPNDVYVNGKGTSFNAPLNYKLRILNGEAKEIIFNLKDMQIAKLLSLAKQPAFAQGKMDANVSIPTLVKDSLDGKINISLDEIMLNETLLKNEYNLTLPQNTKFQVSIESLLKGEEVKSNINMYSNLADVNLSDITFNTTTQYVDANYRIDVANLKNLYALTHIEMRGALLLNGHIKKAKTLKITGVTHSLGGALDYVFEDGNFNSFITEVPVENVLKMFKFPQFMGARASGKTLYHIVNEKGTLKFVLDNFQLAPNKITKNIGKFFPIDPTAMMFPKTLLEAEINSDEVIYTFVAKSKGAFINIGKGRINHQKDSHEAKIKFGYKKYTMSGSIGGSIRHPHIGFDTTGFLKDNMMMNKAMTNRAKKVLGGSFGKYLKGLGF